MTSYIYVSYLSLSFRCEVKIGSMQQFEALRLQYLKWSCMRSVRKSWLMPRCVWIWVLSLTRRLIAQGDAFASPHVRNEGFRGAVSDSAMTDTDHDRY